MTISKDLLDGVRAGPYCSICGINLPKTEDNSDRRCNSCSTSLSDAQQFLMDYGVKVQEVLMIECRRRQAEKAKLETDGSLTPEQAHQLERCQLVKEKCAYAQQVLDQLLIAVFYHPSSPVVVIEEVNFESLEEDEHGRIWDHCAFRFTLKDGSMFAYDPTGIQFGPESPLLEEWDAYKRKQMRRPNLAQLRPLGSRRAEVEEEKRRVEEEKRLSCP